MRKKSPLDVLISKTSQQILAATILQPHRAWFLSELARHIRRRPSSLQGPLGGLVTAGILRRRRDGNRVCFQADPDCPFLPELQGLLAKTTGLVEVLREALWPFRSRIHAAFIHGSVARAAERAASDIDLIVLGTTGLAELAPALEQAEERLARPVNASVYTAAEFSERIAAGNHFLTAILDAEKLFVVGTADDKEFLEAVEAWVAGNHPHLV